MVSNFIEYKKTFVFRNSISVIGIMELTFTPEVVEMKRYY